MERKLNMLYRVVSERREKRKKESNT